VGRTSVELGIFRDEAERRAFIGERPVTLFRDRELEIVARGGERRVLSLAAESFELDGRIYAVTIARDVTDRVAMQEQLRRARTMEAMGSLVAGVAHEVRNPLFSISATVDAMEAAGRTRRDFSAQAPDVSEPRPDFNEPRPDFSERRPDFSEHTTRLRSQVERLSRLMGDLLDYGKPAQLQPAPTALAGLLERAARSCGALSDERQVRIELAVDNDLPALDVDGARIEQVFENLIANALQHAPAGSAVSVAARLDTGRTPPCVRCTVEDQGPGVAEDERALIFEPFFTRRRGGTGLGLSIVQRVVEAHGGEVTAGPREGGGGCFTVWLPVSGRAAARGSA
jgi:signal transduction histidine kinase